MSTSVPTVLRISVLVFLFGIGRGVLGDSLEPLAPNAVSAQTAPTCPFNTCDFLCSDLTHNWTSTTDGVWVIVDATPVEDMTGEARWYDNGDPNWVPLEMEGTWVNKLDEDDKITSSADIVGNDGFCTYSDPEGDFIHCHDFRVLSGSSDLCDNYSGNWDRIGLSPSIDYCLMRIEYGFDFRKEVWDETVVYCFEKAEATSVEPTGTFHLDGRAKTPAGGCGSSLMWANGETVSSTQCRTIGEERPGGSDKVRMTVRYSYTERP